MVGSGIGDSRPLCCAGPCGRRWSAATPTPTDLAYLEDRVRVNAGRAQRYGTRYGMTSSGFGSRPIEDPDGLHDRRAQVGLPPVAEDEAEMRRRFDEEP